MEENGHSFIKLNAIIVRVMLNEMKILLGKTQSCRALKAQFLKSANSESANSDDI